jgi:hypothetical protein
MTTRIIYNLVLNETSSTLFEIENDTLYVINISNGVFSRRLDYYDICATCSNHIIITQPNISPNDWNNKYEEDCVELMKDIEKLPREYKLKAFETMQNFGKDFHKLMRKKAKAMKKHNYTETSNKLEGVAYCRETEKTCCYKCLSTGKLMRCGRCLNISYCSTECSRADWSRHKPNCNSN